jgi:hypothetical protein
MTYNSTDFDVEITPEASRLKVKILKAPTTVPYFILGIYQYFGKVPNLWVEGQGWEGQESIGTILDAHPTWNFYGMDSNGNCQGFYSSGTGYEVDAIGNPVYENGYVKRYRTFAGGVMTFYNARTGVEYFIPYNKYQFNYIDANNSAYPSDYGFGAGILTDGAVHQLSAVFNNCWDANGKPVAVAKSVQIPSAPWTRYNCTSATTTTDPVPGITSTTTAKKGRGK